MTDLSKTISPKSDQLNADDLIAGPITITVTNVSANPSSAEQPVSISFQGDNGKPYKPCKSMRRVMVHIWGKDGSQYAGRSMTLYRDPEVQFGGVKTGGIRISHMTGLSAPETMALTATRANRKPFTVHPLKVDAPPVDVAALDEAREAARKGTLAFRGWWTANKPKQGAVSGIMDELKTLAAEADAANDDPFGLPPAAANPERAMFENLAHMIVNEAGNAPAAEIRATYADQIAQLETHFPDLFAQVDGALKGEKG